MLVVLTAFLPEARPFIESFGLHEQPRRSEGKVFFGPGVLLGVCGQGRRRAAGMTRLLIDQLHDRIVRKDACWLNFGIAGSGSHDVGTMIIAHEVRDADSGEQWCLQPSFETGYPASTVLTVSSPTDTYETGTVHEMEASGMMSALSGQIGRADAMVIKMISDGPGYPIQDLSVDVALSLLKRHRFRIEELIAVLLTRLQ